MRVELRVAPALYPSTAPSLIAEVFSVVTVTCGSWVIFFGVGVFASAFEAARMSTASVKRREVDMFLVNLKS